MTPVNDGGMGMISPNTPPGTEVVCVDERGISKEVAPLAKGSIYTVRAIDPQFPGDPSHAVLLAEIVNPIHPESGLEYSYIARRFRYLHRAASPEFYENVELKEPA